MRDKFLEEMIGADLAQFRVDGVNATSRRHRDAVDAAAESRRPRESPATRPSRAGGDRTCAVSSGKLALLDRMLVKLKEAKARVLLFSQMSRTLDVLEEFALKRYGTTRLDGSTRRTSARSVWMRSTLRIQIVFILT